MKLGRRSLFGSIAALFGAKQAARIGVKEQTAWLASPVFPAGFTPAPSISRGNDPDTGYYFESADTISFVVDGKKVT